MIFISIQMNSWSFTLLFYRLFAQQKRFFEICEWRYSLMQGFRQGEVGGEGGRGPSPEMHGFLFVYKIHVCGFCSPVYWRLCPNSTHQEFVFFLVFFSCKNKSWMLLNFQNILGIGRSKQKFNEKSNSNVTRW